MPVATSSRLVEIGAREPQESHNVPVICGSCFCGEHMCGCDCDILCGLLWLAVDPVWRRR